MTDISLSVVINKTISALVVPQSKDFMLEVAPRKALSATIDLAQGLTGSGGVSALIVKYVSQYASLAAAVAAIGATESTLIIDANASISDNLTCPATLRIEVTKGAVITVANTKTLTINGPFTAPLAKVFTCTGTGAVTLGAGSTLCVCPEWWATNTTPGTTDMSAAVQAAAANASYKILSLSNTYLVSNIAIPLFTTVKGPGLLKLAVLASGTYDPICYLTGARITFDGVRFDGNKAAQPADGFSDSYDTGAGGTGRAARCAIKADTLATGYSIAALVIKNCYFENCYGAAIATRLVSNILIDGNRFLNNNFEGAFLYSSGATRNVGARIVNNISTNTGSGDGTVQSNSHVLVNYDGAVIADNQSYTMERDFVKLENCAQVSVTGNTIDTNSTDYSGVHMQSTATDITITGNTIHNMGSGVVSNTGLIYNVNITGNTISMNAGTTAPDAIIISGGDNVTIANNMITGCNRNGIYVTATTNNLVITGNTIIPINPQVTLSGLGISIVYGSDGHDLIISNNYIGTGFAHATAANEGAVRIYALGYTLTNSLIKNNIVRTYSNLVTERGIRFRSGTFTNSIVEGNYTDGTIDVDATVIFNNKASGNLVSGPAFGNIIGFGSAAPASGAHYVGEVFLHSAPTASSNIGWICVASATPGTWKEFGAPDVAAGVSVDIDAELHVTAATHLDEAVSMSSKLTTPGAWTTPAFDAAFFTASGSMTWTVEAGDVTTYAYAIIGKIMTVAFTLYTTTVGGTPSATLYIKVPASKTVTKAMTNPVSLLDNMVRSIGIATVAAGGQQIAITRTDVANWTASTNQTYVLGQITFEIN